MDHGVSPFGRMRFRWRPILLAFGGLLLLLVVAFLAFIALYAWADIH